MESTRRAYANVLTLLLFISLATICTATAQTCAILNGSFEDDGLINDIAVQEPNAWTVDIAGGKFVGYIYTAWRTDGFYGLTLYSKKRVQLFAGDTVTVSQQMDLAAVSEITFDVKLDTAFGAWDPAVCSAVLLIDGDVVWRSNSVGSDVRGVYLGQVYAVEEKYRTAGLHTLSLGMRMNVDSYFWTDGLYMTQWDNIRVVCAPPHPLRPVIYVDADALGANDGTSWENAYKYLQAALADANSAEKPVEIRVAQGVYKPDEDTLHPKGTGDRTAAFRLINGVTVKGGYAGASSTDPNDRNIELYETILSGDLNGNDAPNFANNGDNCYHIFYHPEGLNLDDTAILDGFTITVGNANNSSSWPHYGGGGMCNIESSPTVQGCTFSGNSAVVGGGMLNDYSSPNVNNCTFTGNSAGGGGAMYNYESSATVDNCTFSGNSAWGDGGGIHNRYDGSPTLTNCTFSGNSAWGDGGGMFNEYYSSPKVEGCTFSGNLVNHWGGGICNDYYSSVTVTNCILSGDAPEEIYGETPIVTYSDIQGGWPGTGNIDADPCFVADFHLGPDSPCINMGDPCYVPEPNETDMDGEARVMWERVDMGADEFNPIRFVDPNRKRISRTEFLYDCNVSFTNLWPFAIENVQLEILNVPDNMDINDPNVSFGDIEFSPRESITSIDTCTFRVNRSRAIDPSQIIWRVSCTRVDTGMPIELTIGGVESSRSASISSNFLGQQQSDFPALAALAGQWLWTGTPGGIDQDIVQDGSVNLADFAEFAAKWRGSEQ